MSVYNINVKCFKTHEDSLTTIYFETHSKFKSGLALYDVYTLTREHFRDLLSSSTKGYILEVKVECNNDYVLGKTKIPSCV